MNKIAKIILIFFFVTSCSLDSKTGIWNEPQEKIDNAKKTEKIFKKEKKIENELNSNLKIDLKKTKINKKFSQYSLADYKGNLEKISKVKFSKIDNFDEFSPNLASNKKNIFFFDGKGSILKFDYSLNLIWKKNYYLKSEKKLKPFLSLAVNEKILIVTDNISKYYGIDVNSGELLWLKYNSAPFNSDVKIYKDKFLVVDFDNTLRCFAIKDGKEIWNVKTEKSFIKSQKNLSLLISKNIAFFNNSIGDVSAVNIENGNLIWQTPTQSSSIYENAFLLKTSKFSLSNKSLIFSNNRNEFLSLDRDSGLMNWKLNIESNLRPLISKNLILTISNSGYLILINESNGQIMRINDIFKTFKDKKRKKISPLGFIANREKLYLTTSNGKLLVVKLNPDKNIELIKIDNKKISRPFIINQNLFIVTEKSIIKFN